MFFRGMHHRTTVITAASRENCRSIINGCGEDLGDVVRFVLEAADSLHVCNHCDARPCFDCRGASLADCAPAVTKYIQEVIARDGQ